MTINHFTGWSEETYSLLMWNPNSLWVYYTANENDKARYVLKTSAFYDSTFTVPTFSCTDWTSLTQSKVCVFVFLPVISWLVCAMWIIPAAESNCLTQSDPHRHPHTSLIFHKDYCTVISVEVKNTNQHMKRQHELTTYQKTKLWYKHCIFSLWLSLTYYFPKLIFFSKLWHKNNK